MKSRPTWLRRSSASAALVAGLNSAPKLLVGASSMITHIIRPRCAPHTAARKETTAGVRVLFQPHLYSRTQMFAKEFAQALTLADSVVVTSVYAAREVPRMGPRPPSLSCCQRQNMSLTESALRSVSPNSPCLWRHRVDHGGWRRD